MYESASERWSPVQSVEKVILSVISMLAGTFLCLILQTKSALMSEQSLTWRVVPTLTAASCTAITKLYVNHSSGDSGRTAVLSPHRNTSGS